ncbi:hypothetical protein [Clostridium perfringens]|uniref:hypothetical protein n=1 Tax=Clostridium perfringens TaxID=1502 RepID=UPI00016BCA7B|nr:hypothetical protein [Clostridium perfringens]EGT3599404.1 hypothetical protein [Clostridium perfringens]EHK2428215.1 hypothetical protein [Clostridium perfringens]ELC8384423.1 hypothetical protein [Clostridium perfringens]MDK0902557.1 hypothetical protein [Clostridium perfringens]
MSNDITYSELVLIKSNINEFNNKLEEIAISLGHQITKEEKDFYIFISKHIIFFKYLYNGMNNQYFFKVMISDLYYFILSILKGETRYVYLNERSIIENYTRAITRKTVEEDHVTENLFLIMKGTTYSFDFTESDYALIKNEYTTSCGYIHGGNILNDNLASVLNECLENNILIKDINKYHNRIKKILKVYDKMLISQYGEYISGRFHRRKTIFEYLLGKECLELLFFVIK